ncbi:BLUF domain-containing protein [Acinetobacter sp. S40]|uniref:BLUF domain-containing protein n=1 Tax=Acinetobacter sp. S40 TaxID=2767434 RepID=UPI0019094FDE|nr:BLUF domain-containing protein [Acinetobacter sp. S40]MBJ9985717.1 BLUF domain-containing protein [Acinetobacter sp. S40]
MKIQLCYASTRNPESDDLLQDLNDILTIARDFNSRHDICGVLYYADGSFFQCLQGEKEIVEQLFSNIRRDERHCEIVSFEILEIEETNFKDWSMKYVQRNSEINKFFKSMNFQTFSPSILDTKTLPIFLNHLYDADQTQIKQKVGMNNRGVNKYI